MTYQISHAKDIVDQPGTAGQPIADSEHLGAKVLRKPIMDAIRFGVASGKPVLITVSTNEFCEEFQIEELS